MRLLYFLPALVAAAATETPCSCTRLGELEATVSTLVDELRALKEQFAKAADKPATRKASEEHESSTPEQRRLQAAGATSRNYSLATYVSLPSRHVHEFPDGHDCPTLDGLMKLLPRTSSGSISYDPSPNDVTSDVSLVKVESDWSTTAVNNMAAPYKIVHETACAAEPSLELQLNTTVAQSLTVTGHLMVGGTLFGGGISGGAGLANIQDLGVLMCNFGTGSPTTSTGRQMASAQEIGPFTTPTREDCVRYAIKLQFDGTQTDVRGVTWGANQGNKCYVEVGGCTTAQGCATPNQWQDESSSGYEACRFPAFN